MTLIQALNFIGLMCITAGGIYAALSAPTPKYASDGSVGLADPDKGKRIAIYRRQKFFPHSLMLVAFGAFLQAVAIFLPSGNGG